MSLLLLFNQAGSGTITGSLIVTDTADVVAFSGTVPVPPAPRYLAPSRYDYGWYNGRPGR